MNALLFALLSVAFAAPPEERVTVRGFAAQVPSVETARPYASIHLLVVGIDRYLDPNIAPLTNAVTDADGVLEVLRRRYRYDSFTLLRNEEATRKGVLATLDELASVGENDAVFVFWAGHGFSSPVEDGEPIGYLVPHDGTMIASAAPTKNLPMSMLRTYLADRVPAKHKLLVVDTCFGGLLATRELTEPAGYGDTPAYVRQATSRPTFQVLAAGQGDQAVLDGGPRGHSVFTHRLIQTLEAANDFVSGQELAARVLRHVSSYASDRGHVQTPVFHRLAGAGTGDFVLLVAPMAPTPAYRAALSTLRAENPSAQSCAPAVVPWAQRTAENRPADPLVVRDTVFLASGVQALGETCLPAPR